MHSMGLAPELLQARVREQMAAAGQNPPPAPEPVVEEAPKVEVAQTTKTNEELIRPETEALEMLPDEELFALAKKSQVHVDGRWGRKRLLDALLAAGVTDPGIVLSAPPPEIV